MLDVYMLLCMFLWTAATTCIAEPSLLLPYIRCCMDYAASDKHLSTTCHGAACVLTDSLLHRCPGI